MKARPNWPKNEYLQEDPKPGDLVVARVSPDESREEARTRVGCKLLG